MTNGKMHKSDTRVAEGLTPEQYRVLRQHGTERGRHQPAQS